MPGVLIISRDWQSRALLRAQLIEEGCDVRAFTSTSEATASPARPAVGSQRSRVEDQKLSRNSTFLPDLVLADVSLVSDSGEIDALKALAENLPAGVPLWLIASHGSADNKEWIAMLKGPRLEKVLFRPLDAGKLLEKIKSRIGASTV